jgi:hypothetical protein
VTEIAQHRSESLKNTNVHTNCLGPIGLTSLQLKAFVMLRKSRYCIQCRDVGEGSNKEMDVACRTSQTSLYCYQLIMAFLCFFLVEKGCQIKRGITRRNGIPLLGIELRRLLSVHCLSLFLDKGY